MDTQVAMKGEGYEARVRRLYRQLELKSQTAAGTEQLEPVERLLQECYRHESPMREELFVLASLTDCDLVSHAHGVANGRRSLAA